MCHQKELIERVFIGNSLSNTFPILESFVKKQLRTLQNDHSKVASKIPIQQERIIHRSGLNNENNKIKIKNSLKSKIKDFIFNSTMVKADIF